MSDLIPPSIVPNDEAPDAKCRNKLPAEVVFDRAAYGGISYFAQAITGIVLARWMRDGSGRPIFDKISKWVGPNFTSKVTGKTGLDAVKEASTFITVTTMIMVGNAFILPVKWLENRKPKIVRWLTERDNTKRAEQGNPITEEERKTQEASLYQLDHRPKQTWTSLLSGRAFGLAGVYSVIFALGNKRNEALQSASADMLVKGTRFVGLKKLASSKLYKDHLQIGFVDMFYSAIAAGGLYVYSHFICPPKNSGSGNDLCSPPPPDAAIPPALPAAQEEKPRLFTERMAPAAALSQSHAERVQQGGNSLHLSA